MNLVLVGINHRTAPVEVRERMNIDEARLAGAVANLAHRDGILEGMILSTCNRVELAASLRDAATADSTLRQFLADFHRCDLSAYDPYFYWHRQGEVVRHLFRVASSLDSMIVGEPQILGQVKQAYAVAREVGALNGPLNEVVNQALAVARKVRRETAIGTAAVSVSYAAVELAKKIFGNLNGKTIFVIGAGKMSELAAKHLLRSGATTIFVANRTYGRAVELAQAFHGTAIRYEELFDQIEKADIVISSTGAPHFVIEKAQAEKLLAARKNRPMFFVDIAVPRDIDPAVNELDNAFVYDIDDLEQVVDANKKQREREAVWAEEIVQQEVQKMMRRLASREVVPTIVALEERLNRIRETELERHRGKLASLTPEQREAVDGLMRGIVNKILHGPITELKSGAGRPEHGALVQLVRKMFGVGE
ncbi:MAG: glutamyl-tRNA reductase [Acidobacteria bacterium]|nr:glutamyl-tRNA reductase [Acidobacteriota bacterium]